MEISLSGRSAIVTGGSKGIGFAIGKRFAESGGDVAIVARGREALDEAVSQIKAGTNAHVVGIQGDVGKAEDVQRAYDEAMAAFGKVDIMVNNAGTSRAGPFEAMSDELLQEDLELKLFAAVRFCRLVMPQMKERKWGRIINVLNIGAKAPRAASAPTSVSRAAGMALTKALASEYAPYNILVNGAAGRADRCRPACAEGEEPRHLARRVQGAARRRTFRSAASAAPRSSPTWRASSPPSRAPTSPARRSTSTAAARRWCESASWPACPP